MPTGVLPTRVNPSDVGLTAPPHWVSEQVLDWVPYSGMSAAVVWPGLLAADGHGMEWEWPDA